ncbi:MAG TPA: alpha/beta hydrolase [Thermopetrobacter sp.]|nr:alpha/beta hydrolase [Thermopetrobacter sp.]
MDEWLIDGAGDDRPLLILAHGAGAGPATPFMSRMAAAIADHGVMVARFAFAYMRRAEREGRRIGPGRAERLMEEYAERVRHWRDRAPVFIGGKSMGGRVASLIADELHDEGLVAGLICLGYPFHPPGRPELLRTRHLEGLRAPALICQGERDPFGRRAEVAGYALSPTIGLCWLPDGDHDLKPRVKSGESWRGNLEAAARRVAGFIHRLA